MESLKFQCLQLVGWEILCENKFFKAISTNFVDSNMSIFSPKSPPNSPNTELAMEDDLKGVYINDTTYKVRSTCFSHMKLELFFWLLIH